VRSRRVWPVPYGVGVIDRSVEHGGGPCGFARSALAAARAIRTGDEMLPPRDLSGISEYAKPGDAARLRMRRIREARPG
jgi:hypothetical protein